VQEGGHAVQPDRILARYPRTLRHLNVAVRLANLSLLYDTSAPVGAPVQPPRLVAKLRGGQLGWQADDLPRWAQSVLTPRLDQ
jgi:predicted ABC-type ATPase